MREEHLKTLGLSPDATDQEIKKAYRRLSKEYHPDLNKSPQAHEKFLQLKESYQYLMGKIPTSNWEWDLSMDDEESEIEKWRKEARARRSEQEREKYLYIQQLIIKLLRYITPVTFGILLFNILLVIDYSLPYAFTEQDILGVEEIHNVGRGYSYHRYNDVYFSDYTMRFNYDELAPPFEYEDAFVLSTKIFDKAMYVEVTMNGSIHTFKQIYNIYHVFGYIIPAMHLFGFLFIYLKKPQQKLNMAIVIVVVFFMQLYIFSL